jgi:hypothetical protein
VGVRVTLRHVGDISDTASGSFCDAVMEFLLHRVEGLFGSDGLPITFCTSERPVLDKRSNLTSQASVRLWMTASRFVFLPTNRDFDLFIDILSRTNSRSIVEGGNRDTSL